MKNPVTVGSYRKVGGIVTDEWVRPRRSGIGQGGLAGSCLEVPNLPTASTNRRLCMVPSPDAERFYSLGHLAFAQPRHGLTGGEVGRDERAPSPVEQARGETVVLSERKGRQGNQIRPVFQRAVG